MMYIGHDVYMNLKLGIYDNSISLRFQLFFVSEHLMVYIGHDVYMNLKLGLSRYQFLCQI
jgi:hypothetical protein